MRIEIDLSVANEEDAHQWLDRILYKVQDGWHVWDITRDSDPEAFRTTTWISARGQQGEWVSDMLVASIKRGAWSLAPHERRVRVTMHTSTTDDLKPEDATRLAEEPLMVLVENRLSDGAFVERVAKELDNGLRKLWDKPGDPVRFDSVGGMGQMLDEVDRRSRKARFRPRLVVVVDSGRKSPGSQACQTARALCRKCQELELSCWVLAKRESENYLPRILLCEKENAGADHRLLVEAWDRLNEDQKDFFDMKDGLPDNPSDPEEALFRGLSQQSGTLLRRGFGKNVYKCWTRWHGQAKTELRRRGRGDLDRGIALIRQAV